MDLKQKVTFEAFNPIDREKKRNALFAIFLR